jgi:hypothetical protein
MALTPRGTDPDHQAHAAPKLDVLAIDHALGFLDCLGIVATNQRLKSMKCPSKP